VIPKLQLKRSNTAIKSPKESQGLNLPRQATFDFNFLTSSAFGLETQKEEDMVRVKLSEIDTNPIFEEA